MGGAGGGFGGHGGGGRAGLARHYGQGPDYGADMQAVLEAELRERGFTEEQIRENLGERQEREAEVGKGIVIGFFLGALVMLVSLEFVSGVRCENELFACMVDETPFAHPAKL